MSNFTLFPEEQSALTLVDRLVRPGFNKIVPLLHETARQKGIVRTIEEWCMQSQPDMSAPFYRISPTLMAEQHVRFPESCDISFFRFEALAYNGLLHIHPRTTTFINLFTPDSLVKYVRVEEAKYQRDLDPTQWRAFTPHRIIIFPRGCPHAAQTEDSKAWGIALEVRPERLAEDDEDTIVLRQ